MAALVVSGITRCVLKGTLTSGNPMINIMDIHLDITDIVPAREQVLLAVAENVGAAWQDHVLEVIGNQYTFDGTSYIDLDSEDGQTGEVAPDPAKNLSGQGSGAQLPPNCGYLIHKRLESSSRGTRSGRMFLVGIGEGAVDNNGDIDSGVVTAISEAMEDFKDAVNGEYFSPANYTSNMAVVHQPSVGDTSFTEIESMVCDSRVATQRRRLR